MYYGSVDGIYKLELNPTTGLAQTDLDKGTRIAQRASTGGKINGNIEGLRLFTTQSKKNIIFSSLTLVAD